MTRRLVAALLSLSLLLALGRSARADPLRLLVAVSTASGAPGELPLHHAADDAQQVQAVLTSLGGFRASDAILLADPSLAQLDEAMGRMRALARTHAPGEVTFVFYFSGHGDRDRIHLGGETLDVATLAAQVRAVPAGLRVLVTDACRSYPTRMKGASSEPGFAIASPAGTTGAGLVWLFASADGEPAQESDELRGALFTHYWVSALRGAGDANGDGRVTVAESYDFAYSQTLLRSARSSGVLQHPAAVFELREAAPLVLTSTSDGATAISFPRAADAHYLVYAVGSHAVLGEIWGSADREVVLALPPGRYLVERRLAGSAGGAEITLGRGEVRALRASDFRAVSSEALVSKGGEVVLRPDELSLEGGIGASRITGFGKQIGLRYGHSFGAWALGAGVTFAQGQDETSAEDVTLKSVGLDAVVERRARLGPWTFGLGAGLEGRYLHESLVRTDAAEVGAGGYATTSHDSALAPGALLEGHLRLALPSSTWLEVGARGALLFPQLDGTVGLFPDVRVNLGLGTSF
jgi:hypothetical protein